MKSTPWMFIGSGALLLLLFVADVCFGSVRIPFSEIWTSSEGSVYKDILFNYRLPKAITAIVAGSALSLSGLMMQTLFRNPLAGPDVLGVNAGASLGVALLTMLSSVVGGYVMGFGSWSLIIAAVAGAFLVLLLVMLASVRIPDLVSLLLVGMMFGYMAGAMVSILQSLSNPDALKIFVVWTFGSLSAVSWRMMPALLSMFFIGGMLALCLRKQMDVLLLGEKYAQGLGVSVKRIRLLLIVATALLAGGITAFAGPISFIGITVPHICRGLFHSWKHSVLFPACLIIGSSLMLLCDIVSQLSLFNGSLPINAVTAVVGAPVIVWIVLKK